MHSPPLSLSSSLLSLPPLPPFFPSLLLGCLWHRSQSNRQSKWKDLRKYYMLRIIILTVLVGHKDCRKEENNEEKNAM